MSNQMLLGNSLSKSTRSIKETLEKTKPSVIASSMNISNESAEIRLPKIKSQKEANFFNDPQESYSLSKSKKMSLPLFNKERLDSLQPAEKVSSSHMKIQIK